MNTLIEKNNQLRCSNVQFQQHLMLFKILNLVYEAHQFCEICKGHSGGCTAIGHGVMQYCMCIPQHAM